MSAKPPMTGKERAKKFRENNPERARELAREWYHRNKERVLRERVEERIRKEEEQKKKDEQIRKQEEELDKLRNLVVQHGIQV